MSHSAENFRMGILYCCINFGYRKSLDKRGEYHDFLSKIFCLTVPKIFVGESCSVALISGTKKFGDGGGGVWRFYVEKFLSHSAEKFRRGILYCCINFGYRKSLDKGGEYHDFLSKIFCLTVPKFSVGESFNVAFFSGTKKSLEKRGGGTEYQDFPSKFFYLTVPKISVVESTVGLNSGSEKVWRREGSITIFRRNFFVSQCRKLPYGNPLLLH